MVKKLPANAGDIRDTGSIPGPRRSPGAENDNLGQYSWASLVTQMAKESACNVGDPGSIPRLGTSPREGDGFPVQYSCLENSMDRGAWRATVPGVAKSRYDWVTFTTSFTIQYPCLGKPMNRGAWRAILYALAKGQTWLSKKINSIQWLGYGFNFWCV